MMRILLAGLFFWTSAVHAGPVKKAASNTVPTKSISQVLKEAIPSNKATVESIIANFEKMQLSPDYIKLMREKNAGAEKRVIEFDMITPNRFALRSEGQEYLIEFISKDDNHQLKLNNKLIDIDPYASLETTMEKIEKLMGNKSARHPFMQLLLPEAQAFAWLGWAALALGAWGVYTNYKNCGKYEDLAKECRRNDLTAEQKEQLQKKLGKMQGWFTKNMLSTMCSYKSEANTCYERLQSGTAADVQTGIQTPGTR